MGKTKAEKQAYLHEYYLANRVKALKRAAEYHKQHRDQHRESDRKWAKAHPDVIWNRWLRNKYKISLREYNYIGESQGWRCKICEDAFPQNKAFKNRKPLVVDHDHKTGKVRGLICQPCNGGIGFFKEDIQRMLAAIEYLEANK